MAYGTLALDTIQSSTAGTPPQFNDGNGTQIGTLCRAWVNFNGITTAVIRASFNVSSVTRNSAGTYTIAFTNALPDANYSTVYSVSQQFGTANLLGLVNTGASNVEVAPTTSAVVVSTLTPAGGYGDLKYNCVSVFR